MKTKYFCEVCGKGFERDKDAIACEQAHETEKRAREVEKMKRAEHIVNANKLLAEAMKEVNELRKENPDTYVDIDYDGGTAAVKTDDKTIMSIEDFIKAMLG